MSHSAIIAWISKLVNIPEGITLKDFSDGRILTSLLNKLNPLVYTQIIDSSPQKNFQMDMLCVTNLVNNLKNQIPNIPEINCLLIAKHQDINEIIKVVVIIVKLMIESQIAQEAILKLNEEQVQQILTFINQYQDDEPSQLTDRKLLDKIDELEEENQKLKVLLEDYDNQNDKLKQKVKEQDIYIKQKDTEINEIKLYIQKNDILIEDVSGTIIEKLKLSLNQLNKEKKQLQEQNEILERNCSNYQNLELQNQQLQQELIQRNKQDKIIEELKTSLEIVKQQIEGKDQKILKLQDQLKQQNQNQQKECSKLVEIEMNNEQLKQEIEDILRTKNKEIHQLQQQINQFVIQIDTLQTERQETQRSSVQFQHSPRCLDSEFKGLASENIGGYYSESTLLEFQTKLQQKEEEIQQKENLFQQKIKTLEAKVNREKDVNLQHIQITALLQEENKKIKQEFDKLQDTNYQVSRIQIEKQQNMLLLSVIESLSEKILNLEYQQKEQLKFDNKKQPQILGRNSMQYWSTSKQY